ncbi:unnamed protein product [Lymnaea stagnalis]|uniref:VWFA domain-containing protein n=1 Tax=Lymnaea stagnalis TaxID=6523 RepID=A0AAV2H023_LYMST
MTNHNVAFPPGGLLEIVFSFDTTGSMASWLDEVRGRIQDLIQRLQADIPGIRIAVFAHGDYCDSHIYVTKWIDLTTDVAKLCDFVQNVEKTGGGDAPECYELVLKQVRTELSWTPGSRRVLVLIGDNNPHEPHEACNKDKINWKEETRSLGSEGVTIYGVQCGNYAQADRFYKTISMATKGKHLRLNDFGSLFDMMMAICYRESNDMTKLANYENEVRARCGPTGLALDIDAIFASLRDEEAVDSSSAACPLPLLVAHTDSTARTLTTTHLAATKRKSKKKIRTAKKWAKVPSMPLAKKPKANSRLLIKGQKSSRLCLDKYKLKNLPLLKRENVPEINFSLRSLNWENWFLACVSESDVPEANKTQWKARAGKPGWRLRTLPEPRSWGNRLALFEVSVQSGAKGKKHTVYSRFSSHCFGTAQWETRLLSVATSQVDCVLQNGCKVYVRYTLVGQKQKFSLASAVKRYDYAWKRIKTIRPGARVVTKCGVGISAA